MDSLSGYTTKITFMPTQISLRAILLGFVFVAIIISLIATVVRHNQAKINSIELSGNDVGSRHAFNVPPESHPDMLYFRLSGELDGTATITTHHDDNPPGITVEFGPGVVSENWAGEFYRSNAEIQYRPKTATKGKLKIECWF